MLRKLIIAIIVVNFVFMLTDAPSIFKSGSDVDIANAEDASFGVEAFVPEFLELNADLYEVDGYNPQTGLWDDIDWESNPGSINFGELVRVPETGTFLYMAGAVGYAVVMIPVTSGHAYTITQRGSVSGLGLVNAAGDVIPDGAFVMTPDYQYLDEIGGVAQQAMPTGAYLSPPQSASETGDHLVYTSDSDGTTRIIRAFLGIIGPNPDGYIMNYRLGHNSGTGVGEPQYYEAPGGPHNWEPVTQNQPTGNYSTTVTFTLNVT